ncbi:uL15 family ribosomal protein [Patescibacteria group bacterium AH-259-L07]|nr:uL15 family ribosomal protein [Patescibacteria group bacterium AH-259-L07]
MAVTLSNLQPQKGSQGRKKRLGRGNASGHGTYSGRGQKGQRSRSGGKKGLKLKGMRRNIRNLPKLRGFKSKAVRPEVVHLEDIDKKFTSLNSRKANLTGFKKDNNGNIVIGPEELAKMGLIKNDRNRIKILCKAPYKRSGEGGKKAINKKLTISAHAFSDKAVKMIKKAGGKDVILSDKITAPRSTR